MAKTPEHVIRRQEHRLRAGEEIDQASACCWLYLGWQLRSCKRLPRPSLAPVGGGVGSWQRCGW
eukprot:2596066-Pyramimonas_sp.AAC.1